MPAGIDERAGRVMYQQEIGEVIHMIHRMFKSSDCHSWECLSLVKRGRNLCRAVQKIVVHFGVLAVLLNLLAESARTAEDGDGSRLHNRLENGGFEGRTPNGFTVGWKPSLGLTGNEVAVDGTIAKEGRQSLRMNGRPNGFTVCNSGAIAVRAGTTYHLGWWLRARQPATSRCYVFVTSNLGQRVLRDGEHRGNVEWIYQASDYLVQAGETNLAVSVAMETTGTDGGTSWWDEVGIYEVMPKRVRGWAERNLVANPGFEVVDAKGMPMDWGRGAAAKNVSVVPAAGGGGKQSLQLAGTPGAYSLWGGRDIAVKPETTYWITWSVRARQPLDGRVFLFLTTNLGQRVFAQQDRHGDLEWMLNIAKYQTQAGETNLFPMLGIVSPAGQAGVSWWDDIGVYEALPPRHKSVQAKDNPWEDIEIPTARLHVANRECVVWGENSGVRVYHHTSRPPGLTKPQSVQLAAGGRGHDVWQLIISPSGGPVPVSLVFEGISGPGPMPPESLSYSVVRSVPVREAITKGFPLGPTPDPVMNSGKPEVGKEGQSAIFWLVWAPPANSQPGVYRAVIRVMAAERSIAEFPVELLRWGFELPELPHFKSLVALAPAYMKRFYPGVTDEGLQQMGSEALLKYRLSAFNSIITPQATLRDGRLTIDWRQFDRQVGRAKELGATAVSIGPRFGGGASQGWKPYRFAGMVPLETPEFDRHYVELNRQMAARLRELGMLDRAYVYPYDEPEGDYMGHIARLCDLIHEGDPALKVMITTDPATGNKLWGKVNAWMVPSSKLQAELLAARRAAGDEIWIYNLLASMESTPLEHRLFLWQAMRAGAEGGLLWNATFWREVNPWENPTPAPYPIGRDGKGLYRYGAGNASLLYPDPVGQGALVPSLRVWQIRQGVEDYDMLKELELAWNRSAKFLPAQPTIRFRAEARAAFIAPVMIGVDHATLSAGRAEAIRRIVGVELEMASRRPVVVAYPTRLGSKGGVAGYAESGVDLEINGRVMILGADGRFEVAIGDDELARGVRWRAVKGEVSKTWVWQGLQ